MRSRAKWLVFAILIIFQGFVYQQFLMLTESGLRIIFSSGDFDDLIWFVYHTPRFFGTSITSFFIPTISAKLSTAAILNSGMI